MRHSGALAMGMDGVNNAVIPGKAEPEDYVAEITRANDGIVNQRTVYQTATRGFAMVQRLERYGVKFEKDEHGEYAVRRVHRSGSYVLPMPEGKDVKKALYRVLRQRSMREKIRIENRLMPVRVLTDGGRAVGAAALHTRTGEFVAVGAKAVILATGACGRLGLPASGYLYGTYENPTNAGDGYSMAYHAGAELSGIECFQVNPLIKDYNGPACAYVANPFGGYQVNSHGERFVDSDYWSGQMMAEVKSEIDSARGPIYLKVSHLPDETLTALENILHTTERPTRGTFHANRGHDYRTHDVEMHISEIGLCSGHSASGRVGRRARPHHGARAVRRRRPGLRAAQLHDRGVRLRRPCRHARRVDPAPKSSAPQQLPEDQLREAHELIYRPLRHPDGPPQPQVEYKLRRFVNDYVAPPKTAAKLSIAVRTFDRMRGEIADMGARTPHELMRAVEVSFIRDCAEMAARSSLTRTESRWGLYHDRADLPGRDDSQWGYHLNLRKGPDGDDGVPQAPGGPVFRVGAGAGRPAAGRPDGARGGAAAAGRRPGPGDRPVPNRLGRNRIRTAVAAHRRGSCPRGADRRRFASLSVRLRSRGAPNRGGHADRAHPRTDMRPPCSPRWTTPRPRCAAPAPTESANWSRCCQIRPPPGRICAPATRWCARRPSICWPHAGPVTPGEYRRALQDPDHRVRIEAVRALVSVDDVAGVVRPPATRTGRSASRRPPAWPRCGPAPIPSARWSATPIRWCARPRWPRWAN